MKEERKERRKEGRKEGRKGENKKVTAGERNREGRWKKGSGGRESLGATQALSFCEIPDENPCLTDVLALLPVFSFS